MDYKDDMRKLIDIVKQTKLECAVSSDIKRYEHIDECCK